MTALLRHKWTAGYACAVAVAELVIVVVHGWSA